MYLNPFASDAREAALACQRIQVRAYTVTSHTCA